jgi:hypothetical protein
MEIDQYTVKEFETTDIKLASYLAAKNVILVKILPADRYLSKMVFKDVPQALLASWLTGLAEANVSLVIDNYRHLRRDCAFRTITGNRIEIIDNSTPKTEAESL